jgi:hypothetical protein
MTAPLALTMLVMVMPGGALTTVTTKLPAGVRSSLTVAIPETVPAEPRCRVMLCPLMPGGPLTIRLIVRVAVAPQLSVAVTVTV